MGSYYKDPNSFTGILCEQQIVIEVELVVLGRWLILNYEEPRFYGVILS